MDSNFQEQTPDQLKPNIGHKLLHCFNYYLTLNQSNIRTTINFCCSQTQMSELRTISLKPERIIPTFSIPWTHRDQWNDKRSYFPIEGKFWLYNKVEGTKNLIKWLQSSKFTHFRFILKFKVNYDLLLSIFCSKFLTYCIKSYTAKLYKSYIKSYTVFDILHWYSKAMEIQYDLIKTPGTVEHVAVCTENDFAWFLQFICA